MTEIDDLERKLSNEDRDYFSYTRGSDQKVSKRINGEVSSFVKNPNGESKQEITGGYKDEFSTDETLLNGAVFNSEIQDLDGYQFLSSEIASDKDGLIEGTWFDDAIGSNVLREFTAPYNSSNGLSFLAVPKLSRYFRLKFTNNSGENQSYLHIRVRLSNDSYSPQLIQVDQFLPTNSIATISRSVITGKSSDGNFVNIGANDVGALNTSSFLLDVGRNKYSSYQSGVKFGRNSDIDTSTNPEDIWNGGDLYTGMPSDFVSDTLDIFSSSNSDSSSGSGARSVKIIGLDSLGIKQEEILVLNGTSVVTSLNSYSRMSRMQVLSAGTDEFNNGEITARHTSNSDNVFAVMPEQSNQTAICADTVPANKRRIILTLKCEISRANGSAGSANVRFLTRENGSVFRAIRNSEVTTAFPYLSDIKTGILLEPLTDMKWNVFSVSDNNTVATGEFEYIDIDL